MREIKYLVVHCTATPQNTTIESIQKYWRQTMKWKSSGYHFIVKPNGSAIRLQPDHLMSNGVLGHNANSLHVSYIGGKDRDDRTDEQKETLIKILTDWKKLYPNAEILGHRDFPNVAKNCPQFNAKDEYNNI